MCGKYPLCGFQLPPAPEGEVLQRNAHHCTFAARIMQLLQQGWCRWNLMVMWSSSKKIQPKWESGRVRQWITLWRKRCRWFEDLSWEPPMTASPAARSLWSTPQVCDLQPRGLQLRPPRNLPSEQTQFHVHHLNYSRLAMNPKCRGADTQEEEDQSAGKCYVRLTRMQCQVTLHPNVSLGDWRSVLSLKLITCNECGVVMMWFDGLELLFGVFDLYTLPDCQLLVSPTRSIHGSIWTLASQSQPASRTHSWVAKEIKLGHTSMATTRGLLSRVSPRSQIHIGFWGCSTLCCCFLFSFFHGQGYITEFNKMKLFCGANCDSRIVHYDYVVSNRISVSTTISNRV